MAVKNNQKSVQSGFASGIVAIVLTVLGAILFFLSYKTGYYIFGQMNSKLIMGLIICALVIEIAALILKNKLPDAFWVELLPFVITAILAAAAILIVGDRVEGIGNCIVTDYDSGHGGEEAIYRSLVGAVCLLAAMVYTIIGAFSKIGRQTAAKGKTLGGLISGAALGIAAIVAAFSLGGFTSAGASGSGTASGDMASGTYKISLNQNNGNIAEDAAPPYEFLSADMCGLMRMEGRFYIDITLDLDGQGAYSLVSDAYVLEAGKRAEIGDPSGLGLVYKTTSEGTYTTNEDGTVTTSAADHVKFELQTDTYSEQLKQQMRIDLGGSDADGEYDSADYPELIAYVPETTWTLGDGEIIKYGPSSLSGDFTISFNQANGNTDEGVMPTYQFLSADMNGLAKADARFYVDVTLTLDGTSEYTLVAESYVFDSGKRVEIGDPSGLGLVYRTTSEGTYTDNGDGTVTTDAAEHVKFELATDTYSAQMKQMMALDLNGSDEDGEYDSADYPILLDYVPATIFTLDSANHTIVTYEKTESEEEAEETGEKEEEGAAEPTALTFPSDDGATTITFNPDGTYVFAFESYGIEDKGTFTFEDGVLTLVDANGKETVAKGDPLKFTYAYSQSDQLTGDFTIAASDLVFDAAGGEEEVKSVTVPSDDEATSMVFNSDGTYVFTFADYGIEDKGDFTYEGGVLTLVDANGKETTAEGDPLKFTYTYSQSDQLTGEFTVDASDLEFEDGKEASSVTVPSVDEATTMTFSSDGTYVFAFESYGIEDEGTFTYKDGVLTLTDANGKETTAEGDPLEFTYTYSQSDQLTGEFSVPAADLAG